MNALQAQYNDLRGRRADLARAIAAAEEIQETDRVAAGVAVAACGEAPSGWLETSGRRARELDAMKLGLKQFDESMRLAVNAAQLKVARITNQRLEPAQRRLAELKTARVQLLTAAARATTPGIAPAGDVPPGFLKEFMAGEAEIALLVAELAEIAAAIADVQVTP